VRGTASGHRRRRVRGAKITRRRDVRRRTAKGVAVDRSIVRLQTGKALHDTVVPAAATTATAVVVRRKKTGAQRWRRSGVGPAHRFGGERRGVGHGHRGLLGRQEVGR